MFCFGDASIIIQKFEFFNRKDRKELKKMPKKWTGELVALLHDYKITQNALRVAFALPLTPGLCPWTPRLRGERQRG